MIYQNDPWVNSDFLGYWGFRRRTLFDAFFKDNVFLIAYIGNQLLQHRRSIYNNDSGVNFDFLGYWGICRQTLFEAFFNKMSFPLCYAAN